MCLFVVHILRPSSMTWLLVRDSSICNVVCHHYDNPTTAPTGDPSMAGLPWGLQKHAIWHVCGSYPHAPYNLRITMVILLTVP